VEGNNTNNNWWAWEQKAGFIANGDKSGAACGWWGGRWREDFDRAAESGQNAHRFSIEWSRVQPLPDKWDESSLDRYREMARGLTERGMTPLVTLHHFSDPLWLAEMGGWENEGTIDYFIPYVRKVVDALREYVTLWVTINEPNILTTFAYLMGIFPPGKRDMRAAVRVLTNLVRAHAAAYHAIHEVQKEARAGLSMNYRGFLPARPGSPLDRWAASMQSKFFNDFFPRAAQSGVLYFPAWRKRLAEAKGTQDFLGVNYYTQDLVSFSLLKPGDLFANRFYPPDAELSETGFIANMPSGLCTCQSPSQKSKARCAGVSHAPALAVYTGADARQTTNSRNNCFL